MPVKKAIDEPEAEEVNGTSEISIPVPPNELQIKSVRLIETAYFKDKECHHFDSKFFKLEFVNSFIRISKPGAEQVLLVPLANVRSCDMA